MVLNNRPSTAPIQTTATIPIKPPIPAILAHLPTRTHLFRYLIQSGDQLQLNLLILLLDLLTIIRANASQTNWSFDSLEPTTTTTTTTNKTKKSNIRPGTSDGLPTSTHQRFQNRFSTTTKSKPSTTTTSSTNWINHFQELYTPPQLDLNNQWFIPLPLPKSSQTLISLNRSLLPINTNQSTINLGITPLKRVGQIGSQELSQQDSINHWWNQYSSSLWPSCALQSKSQSFDDLLALWPSLHFPTPSLSQLYKVSTQLSKSRTRIRLAPQSISNHIQHLSRTTLLALFHVHLGQPTTSDLEAIERLFPPLQQQTPSPPPQQLQPPQQSPPPPPQQQRPTTSSGSPSPSIKSITRPRGQSTSTTRPSLSSSFIHSPLPPNQTLSPKSHPSSLNSKSQKLRQFFGHEVDSMLPYHSHQQQSSLSSSCRETISFSTLTTPEHSSSSFIQNNNNNRRKSINNQFDELADRPRKRSSTATIDLSLVSLETSCESDNNHHRLSCATPTSPDFISPTTKPHLTRLTIVGTSPTNTPTFLSLDKPRLHHSLQPLGSNHQDDEPIIDGFLRHPPLTHTHWAIVDSQPSEPSQTLKRMTKLEKILGEPITLGSAYAGLGVNVVTEVVEDIEQPEASHQTTEITQNQQSPIQQTHQDCFHSRTISTQAHPTHFSSFIKTSPTRSSINPSSSSRITGKWRLDKLQRFLGDVTHSTTTNTTTSTTSTTSTSTTTPSSTSSLSQDSASYPQTSKIQNAIDSSRFKFPDSHPSCRPSQRTCNQVKKRPSRFKISRPSFDLPTNRTNSHEFSRPSSSASSTHSRPHLSSSSPTPPNFAQYSHRSARKLEQILGEHISTTAPLAPSDDFHWPSNHHHRMSARRRSFEHPLDHQDIL